MKGSGLEALEVLGLRFTTLIELSNDNLHCFSERFS